jgi:predicted HicB family RNase H-like nuclease
MVDRKRSRNLNVRLLDEEVRMLEAIAENDGLSVSDWIRQSIRAAFRRTFAPTVKPKPRRKSG